MANNLVVGELTGTIYDTTSETDRTDECIRTVAEHMRVRAESNNEQKGFWQYRWKGFGTLTWQSENEESEV